MKIKHQLSIATLVMAGVFATGCSQQTAGGSQEAGSSQVSGGSQMAGGSQQQVEGGSQVGGSQQQVEAAAPVVAAPAPAARRAPTMAPAPAPVRRAPARRRYANPWLHYHPEAPKCAKTRKHSHKFKKTGARHHHRYSCQQARRAPARRVMHRAAPKQQVDVFALQQKLKAKGYYKGPIDGIVGPGTRSALQRFMKR